MAEGRLVMTSWYGGGERLNRHTASGEVFRPHGLTAAHRSLPLGTRLAVSYGGRTVVVRVNDRGPAAWTGRSLDLSRRLRRRSSLTSARGINEAPNPYSDAPSRIASTYTIRFGI